MENSLQLRYVIGITVLLSVLQLNTIAAQTVNGITNVPDTSFNLKKEFEKVKKLYPAISIPAEEVKQYNLKTIFGEWKIDNK